MKMSCAAKIVVVMNLCTGCATHHAPQDAQMKSEYQRRWQEVSPNQFSLPTSTPFDDSTEKRGLYLKGFATGIAAGIESKTNDAWHSGDVLPSGSEEERIWQAGWRAGALRVLQEDQRIIEEMQKK